MVSGREGPMVRTEEKKKEKKTTGEVCVERKFMFFYTDLSAA